MRISILLFWLAAPAFAQSTFLALLAEGPDARLEGKLATFGQFVGEWTFEGVEAHDDGTRVTDKGELHFHWILEGRAIQDVWMETERSDHGANVLGTTVRFYDPKTDTWQATWLDPGNGAMRALVGRTIGSEIVFEGTSPSGVSFRWIFSDIRQDSFRWHAERLVGGEWKIAEDLQARRKIAASRLAFQRLSALVGEWKATGKDIAVRYTLTADGSALMEEFRPANQPVMITMFSLDGDHLVGTHYCSAGNQPQMATAPIVASPPDVLVFSLVRITGMSSPAEWHNTGLTIALEDHDHLTQNWTWEDHGRTGTTTFAFVRTKEASR